jgi:hypothetical protein
MAVDVLRDHPQTFIVACGFVNSKNGFGDYTGKTSSLPISRMAKPAGC